MPDLTTAKAHAVDSWYRFTRDRGLATKVPDWRQTTAPDGAPRLTCEVVGPNAADDLHRFASKAYLPLGRDGDIAPTYDYADARVTVVWRCQGVWVELWVPDRRPAAVEAPVARPGPATPGGDGKRLIPRPSGRLPFTRRPNHRKETRT